MPEDLTEDVLQDHSVSEGQGRGLTGVENIKICWPGGRLVSTDIEKN